LAPPPPPPSPSANKLCLLHVTSRGFVCGTNPNEREKKSGLLKGYFSWAKKKKWAYIQRRDSIMAWSVILSVYGTEPIAEVKLFSILHLLFHLDWQKILVKNRPNFPRKKLL
jgi:hypothetical protein